MFIHRVNEGEEIPFGINWMSNENTFLSIKILLPLWFLLPRKHYDFSSDGLYYGWQVYTFKFVYRIRRWKNFLPGYAKTLYSFSMTIRNLGKQELICTREMIEDNKCQ